MTIEKSDDKEDRTVYHPMTPGISLKKKSTKPVEVAKPIAKPILPVKLTAKPKESKIKILSDVKIKKEHKNLTTTK